MISPGSGSNGMVASSDTHVPKTAAEIAATDKAGMIAPSDVRGGRASRETIARIVDPKAFVIVNTKRFDIKARQEIALSQADAILALTPDKGTAERCEVLTAEDIYANAYTTLIGFRDELTEQNIKFICDQISRKVALAMSSANQPPPQAWLEAKSEIDAGWPDATALTSTHQLCEGGK